MTNNLTFATEGWSNVSTELAGQENTVKGAFYRSEPPDLYVPPTHPGQTFRPSAFPALGAGVIFGRQPDDRVHQRREERVSTLLAAVLGLNRSEVHTSELQSLMRISYAVFCLKKK